MKVCKNCKEKVETEPSASGLNKFKPEKEDIKAEEDRFLEEMDSMIDEATVTDRPTFWLFTVIFGYRTAPSYPTFILIFQADP